METPERKAAPLKYFDNSCSGKATPSTFNLHATFYSAEEVPIEDVSSIKFKFGVPKKILSLTEKKSSELFSESYYFEELMRKNIWLGKRLYQSGKEEYFLKVCPSSNSPESKSYLLYREERNLDEIKKYLKLHKLSMEEEEDWHIVAEIDTERINYLLTTKFGKQEIYVDHCKIGNFFYDVATFSQRTNNPKDVHHFREVVRELEEHQVIKPVRSKILELIHLRWPKEIKKGIERRIIPNDGASYQDDQMLVEDYPIKKDWGIEDVKRWAKNRNIESNLIALGRHLFCVPKPKPELLKKLGVRDDEVEKVHFWLTLEPGLLVEILIQRT